MKNASIFGVSIFGVPISSRNFLVQKLTVIKVFYEIRQRNHLTGRDRWALGIDRVSELLRKCFWPKIGDFDKAHQKFWNFENFENFQKMRQSLARQSLAKDCICPNRTPSGVYFPFLSLIFSPLGARWGHMYSMRTDYCLPSR